MLAPALPLIAGESVPLHPIQKAWRDATGVRFTVLRNRRSDLGGTFSGEEVQRRLTIIFDKAPDFLLKSDADTEEPAFSPGQSPPPPLPNLPKPRP